VTPFRNSVVLSLLALGAWDPAVFGRQAGTEGDPYDQQVRPFLARHCAECHGTTKPKGNFRLEELTPDFAEKSEERWASVLEQLGAGAMPPKAKPRPPQPELRAVRDWIARRSAQAASGRRAAQGRVVLRRLNRNEYVNTVRDLLGVDADLSGLLALDGASDGFDNVGTGLHLSSFAIERYLDAAGRALDVAIANRPAPKVIKKQYSLKTSHNVRNPGESVFRVDGDTVVCFTSAHYQRVHVTDFWPPDRGHYRVRVSASAVQSEGKPVSFDLSGDTAGLVDYFDAPADTPAVFERVVRMEAHTCISILPFGLPMPGKVTAVGADHYTGPGLALQWVEVEGPLFDTWPPESHRRLFGDLPQVTTGKYHDRLEVTSAHPLPDAARILRGFAGRAFRRPVGDADVQPFLDIVESRLAEKDSFEQAVRAGLSAVLASPRFLFLDERPGKLDDYALASRLSYFFWSSMPDDELFALAAEGKLRRPEILRQQVERMLKSPKAEAFTTHFCGQWLALRDIDFTSPHYLLYPEFDAMLKVSMVKETELFFQELLANDLSVTNFVASDFSMLNGRLARHYGIPGVEGLWQFRKVPLPPESHRGGVLTMASVLKVTADGTSTSPVKRGAWILDRILGTPPSRPPADVPPLEPDIRGAKSIREQLAKHRNNPACASCHAQIDPPGFALESFDVIGGWREFYRLQNWVKGAKEIKGVGYLRGPDVDATGVMADGVPFQSIDEFKKLLLRDADQIARSLVRKLVTYATGGAPEPCDQAEVESIVSRVREKKYGLRTLVHEIVLSRMFGEK
jgi:mono/diheme cytochrome c family protein